MTFLKLLVTCEALGRDSAEKTWIYERLWPDADSEKARKSLEMTVARLRKLLRSEQSILATEGRLQLSQSHAWTDIRLLRQALSHATHTTRRSDRAEAGRGGGERHCRGARTLQWAVYGRRRNTFMASSRKRSGGCCGETRSCFRGFASQWQRRRIVDSRSGRKRSSPIQRQKTLLAP